MDTLQKGVNVVTFQGIKNRIAFHDEEGTSILDYEPTYVDEEEITDIRQPLILDFAGMPENILGILNAELIQVSRNWVATDYEITKAINTIVTKIGTYKREQSQLSQEEEGVTECRHVGKAGLDCDCPTPSPSESAKVKVTLTEKERFQLLGLLEMAKQRGIKAHMTPTVTDQIDSITAQIISSFSLPQKVGE